MKRLVVFSLFAMAAAASSFADAETDITWKWDKSARTGSGAYVPVAPVAAQGASSAAWACPNWVEAYASGGFTSVGMILIVR